jgi:hypothetical protein
VAAIAGLGVSFRLPSNPVRTAESEVAPTAAAPGVVEPAV